MIEANIKERAENEKKIAYALSQQIDSISSEVTKETIVKNNSKFEFFFQAQQVSHPYIDAYLNEDLPKIADELQNEIQERREIEEKIYHQFIEQLNDLKELFER